MIDISESPTSVFDPPVFLAPRSLFHQLLAMEDEDEEWPQRWILGGKLMGTSWKARDMVYRLVDFVIV